MPVKEVCAELKTELDHLEKAHCDCVPGKIRCVLHERRKRIDAIIDKLHTAYQEYIRGFEG